MSPGKRTSSLLNGHAGHRRRTSNDGAVPKDAAVPRDAAVPEDVVDPSGDPDDALALAEEAEAEALAAEAAATAARARARAMKLRRQATANATAHAVADDTVPPASTQPAPPTSTTTEPAELEADSDHGAVDTALADEAADDDVVDAEVTDEGLEPTRPRRRRPAPPRPRRAWVAAAVVVLCAMGLLGAGGYMTWRHGQVEAQQQRSAELAAAARQGVVTLMSLDFNNAKEDVKRILDNTTGDFKKDFEGQAEQFADVAQASKVVTEATVSATAVQSVTENAGTVLVAVTTQVSNAASKEQQPRSWRLRVDMARDGGQLKLSKVEFVP